jgi:ZIP family zinc transporter
MDVPYMDNPIVVSLYLGLLAAATTSLGALPVAFSRSTTWRHLDVALAFSAGVMLVSSFTSLILPAIEISKSFLIVSLGILAGVVAIRLIDRFVPHEHLYAGYEGPAIGKKLLKKVWLLALAVIIHNLPEGLAIGVSTAYSIPVGIATGIAISIQDVPEGLAVALPASATGGVRKATVIAVLSGLSETLMAVLGAVLFTTFSILLPIGMGFAGGAMLYVTIKELVPEIYREEHSELKVTAGFIAGFLLMLYLDSAL